MSYKLSVKTKDINNKIIEKLLKNGDFSTQIDKYSKNKLPTGDVLYLGNTPIIMQNLGIKNNPITLKQSKLKK